MKPLYKVNQKEFEDLYSQHVKWLSNKSVSRPDFSYIDFQDVKLPNSINLEEAILVRVNLKKANLEGTNLKDVRFIDTNFTASNIEEKMLENDLSNNKALILNLLKKRITNT